MYRLEQTRVGGEEKPSGLTELTDDALDDPGVRPLGLRLAWIVVTQPAEEVLGGELVVVLAKKRFLLDAERVRVEDVMRSTDDADGFGERRKDGT
ncbi:MAG: hypothetical protein IPG04_16905 [Polyangiaceae bacterium]|nr:hypothetical protein [Polyangiaceae bacterium]